jgi:Leucine-rich repeat (LRR) protein
MRLLSHPNSKDRPCPSLVLYNIRILFHSLIIFLLLYILQSFPPLKSASLQELRLSFCESLKIFPEILGEMKNITHIALKNTSIEKVPLSFQNLTGLFLLIIEGNGMLRLPSSICSMPNLSDNIVDGCILPKLDDKLSSMVTTIPKDMYLRECNLLDQFLPILVMWSANVERLDLSGNNFTILPECIKGFPHLWKLTLDDCKCLREIRGIPPKLKWLSAKQCKSLTSWSRNMLLNQVFFPLYLS